MANENENIQNSQVADDTLLDFYPRFSNFVALYRGITRTWIDEQGVLWAEFVDGSTQEIGPVASYYYAVQSGYTGTVEEWIALLLSVSDNAESAAASASAASQSETAASQSATSASASASTAEQWATGNTGGTPTATNNSKYYSEQAATSSQSAASSASTASEKASDAATSESNAQQYASNASSSAQEAAQSAAEIANLKGAPNGLAELDSNGLVPSSQLPSYVDDVLEYQDEAHFPVTGESGKIYIDLSTNRSYRWSGSTYVVIASDLALGETSATAYRGDRGKAAYDAAVVNVDSTPTTNSTNLITSGGVKAALPETMTGATSSAAGTSGLVPQPSAGDEGKVLKGNGTWGDVDALPIVTSSDNGKVLEVVNGEWTIGSEKIDKKYDIPFSSNWSIKTWNRLTDFYGSSIWTDGDNIYYSKSSFSVSDQYVLDKSTSIWSSMTWNGFSDISGYYIWTDGDDIYLSNGSSIQYVLDKSTSTWSAKTWNGLTTFNGRQIWTDGNNIYCAGYYSYILDKSTSTWSLKEWNGLENVYNAGIWTDGDNIYYSYGANHYILDKSTSTWSAKTWNGLTNFYGEHVWTNNNNIYYSYNSNQYILDKSTSTWSVKEWTGLTEFNESYIWTDGENIYCSNGSTQYALDKDNSSKLLLGTNGQFNAVSVDEVISDMIGASDSTAGSHGLVPTPSAGDEGKFLKGDGTWDNVEALPVVTSSDNGKVLEVNNGEWAVGNEKIDKKYKLGFSSNWSAKEWTELTSFSGGDIWTDGENIYYSHNSSQYILNKSTSTWSVKEWAGSISFDGSGYEIWSDGENVYYSFNAYQYVLDKSTSTWSTKEWNGLTNFTGDYVWTDGDNIYYSNGSNQYVLDKSTSTWSVKQWTGITSIYGNSNIWTDGENIYYSMGSDHYVLNKSTSAWSTKEWSGLTNFYGGYTWTDGENIYYSNGSNQYILNKSTSAWSVKEWTGLTNINGGNIWTDGDNIYFSSSSTQYILEKDNSNKLLFGSNGEFSLIAASEILPSDMTGASSSTDGTHGLVPAPAAGDEDKFLKGNGTWDNVDALPTVTSSDNNKVLEVVDGEWATGSKKIDKEYESSGYTDIWEAKTWSGLTSFAGQYVWSDGDNIYYSNSSNQYVLNKSTSTWSTKSWTGLAGFYGYNIWSDGDNIYHSNSSTQYVLNKSTSTWSKKSWTGLTIFSGKNVWTDGDNIYYSSSSKQYVLDKSTSTWSAKTWTGLTSFDGGYVWSDGDNIYYSYNTDQYVLNKSTSAWSTKSWTGLTNFNGNLIWKAGNNIYYSNSSTQRVLDKSTSTWSAKTWTGLTNFNGSDIWSDGDNIYYSNSSTQYLLYKDNSPKLLFGTNGEFSPVNASEVLPSDMTGASSSAAGTHGLVPAPAQGDQDKFLKGDGTWGEVNTSSSTVRKVSFTIATTDWTQSSNTYVADVTDSHITSMTEELIMYTNSVKNLTSDIDTNKDGTNNKITFIVDSVPTGSISGSIYIISQGNIVADTKVDIDQGVANAGKFLVVNSQGNVEPVTMQAWQGGSY